jgi:hypothetical protein
VRWQKSVRRIARRDARGAARQIGGAALAEELSERRADALDGGSEARTVRELRDAFDYEGKRGPAVGATRSITTRRKASRSSLMSRRKARHVEGLGRAGQREAGTARCTWSKASHRRMEPTGGVRDDDEGRQRSVMCMVKAAPADEARAVRHPRRREALALEVLERGLCGRCESDAAIG